MPPNTATPHRSWASADDHTGFYLVITLICSAIGLYLLWGSYHGQISAGVLALFHGEMVGIGYFDSVLVRWDRWATAVNPERLSVDDLIGVATAVGTVVRIPAAVFIVVLAVVCMVRAAPSRYRRQLDLDGLVREQARSYPTTGAFVERRLRLVAPADGLPLPSDYALTTDEWIVRFAHDAGGMFVPASARHALVRQLGPIWRGVDQASPSVRLMFAVFALHLAERRSEAVQLLGLVSVALATDPDPTSAGSGQDGARTGPRQPLQMPAAMTAHVDAALRSLELTEPALAVAGRHGFAHTALMALLVACRAKAGVLAPGQFAFLKLVDRPLWYALHSLGFETEGLDRYMHPAARVEAAGARDHWAVERIAKRPVAEPSVDRALDAVCKVAAAMKARRDVDEADPERPGSTRSALV